MEKEVSLFKLCFRSLSFRRHYSSMARNGAIAAFGFIVFGIGFPLEMLWLYILGAVIGGCCTLMVIAEALILLLIARRAKRIGFIARATAVKAERSKARNRYQLTLKVQLKDGSFTQTVSEGPLWEVDARIMTGKSFRIIFLGADRTAVLIP